MAGKKKLLWQLYPSYLLITIISLVAVTWYASSALKHFFLEQVALDLRSRAHLLENQVLERLNPLDKEGMDRLCKRNGEKSGKR